MNVALPEQRMARKEQFDLDLIKGLHSVSYSYGPEEPLESVACIAHCFPTGLELADTQVAQGQTGGRPSLVVGLFCSLARISIPVLT